MKIIESIPCLSFYNNLISIFPPMNIISIKGINESLLVIPKNIENVGYISLNIYFEFDIVIMKLN